jgi:ATP dependent DNA ligase domain
VGDADLYAPIEPMKVTSVAEWPPGRDWRYEMKLDGWRLVAFRQARRVFLQSRAVRDLSRYFPNLAEAIGEALPPGTVLDSEVVIWSGARADFAAPQRRITVGVDPEAPAYVVAFEILQDFVRGIVLSSPLTARRSLLEELLVEAPPAIPLCPHTAELDVAQEWMSEGAEGIGIEGVVMKRARSRYRPGGTGWLKRRVTQNLDLVVGGVTGTLDRPTRCSSAGRSAIACPTSGRRPRCPLPRRPTSRRCFGLRSITAHTGMWPLPLPARWVGFHQDKPLACLPVRPLLTVEVLADTAYEYGRFRHPLRFLRYPS